MSEFSTGDLYIELHTPRLQGLLDVAEELSLFHTPDTIVEQKGTQISRAEVSGKQLEDFDMEMPEGIHAGVAVESAQSALITFRGIATMHLFLELADSRNTDYGELSEEEKQLHLDAVLNDTKNALDPNKEVLTATDFTDTQTDENITVSVMRLGEEEAPFVARELNLVIQDGVLTRKLTIDQIGWRASANLPHIRVRQSILPTEDPELRDMAKFFTQRNDPESYRVITMSFADYLRGAEPEGLDSIYSEYDGPDRGEVEEFIALMRRRAEAAQANSRLLAENPGLALPSALELEGYTALLSQMRS